MSNAVRAPYRYVKRLADFMWDGQVKVISGIRGCGKSYLLHTLFREHLLSSGVAEDHILSCDLDTDQELCYRNPLDLASCFRKRVSGASGQFYLFIDGIHKCEAVSNPYIPDGTKITVFDALNDLKSLPNLDVYVISDTSMLLPSNIPTEFRGRSDQIRVHPLSFSEYYAAVRGEKQEAFEEYAVYGGMLYCLSLDEDARKEYLSTVLFEGLLKEIAEGRKIRRPEMLSSLAEVLSLSASLTGPADIACALNAGQIQNGKRPVALNTVKSHLDCLSDVFLFSQCRRHDVSSKYHAGFPGRYYCEDTGLMNAAAGFGQPDMPHLMENILFNELVARDCEVSAGIVYDTGGNTGGRSEPEARGIDFIADCADRKFYLQSAYALGSAEKYAAESRPLKLVQDTFPKIMVRHDVRTRWYDDYGILNIGVLDFLLDDTLLSRYP